MAHNETKEKGVEAYLCRRVKALGGMAVKLTFVAGIPDRLVLLPGGVLLFVELKRPRGGRLSPVQRVVHERLRALGFEVRVPRNTDAVDALLKHPERNEA